MIEKAENTVESQEPVQPTDPTPEAALAEKIRILEEEAAALRDQRVRALAEIDNVRKRSAREQEDMLRYAVSGFAGDMVSVLENLRRASDSIHNYQKQSSDEAAKSIAEGVDLTLRELLAIFEKYHIRRIDPLNEKFDHNMHQAVAQMERGDVAPGTVVQVIQAGYMIHDRLLRPAMVAVAKAIDAAKTVDTTA